ncbi:hypothetical protein BVER_05655c [Candidatus Burkholderia verschuerenii]|uniref:Uncharacterized protein n=1 Tax=Candidatus Burkholderia verschuerenii TaxID=242163 RepID=A0A0L0MD18_9BURK|nr:hypothetical protein [Candidatus Burkholderia verschuerenii]KND60577.1 hypothetical protein BVER_05655c [Candidatus Burkholderia verschuerenii]
MAGPNTHREALIAELLGDVGDLLDRAEALKATLPAAVDTAVAKVRGAGETAAGSVNAAGDRFLSEFSKRAAGAMDGMVVAAKESHKAAQVVDKAATRFAIMAGVVGLAAGLLGGILAALAISHHFFGG